VIAHFWPLPMNRHDLSFFGGVGRNTAVGEFGAGPLYPLTIKSPPDGVTDTGTGCPWGPTVRGGVWLLIFSSLLTANFLFGSMSALQALLPQAGLLARDRYSPWKCLGVVHRSSFLLPFMSRRSGATCWRTIAWGGGVGAGPFRPYLAFSPV